MGLPCVGVTIVTRGIPRSAHGPETRTTTSVDSAVCKYNYQKCRFSTKNNSFIKNISMRSEFRSYFK